MARRVRRRPPRMPPALLAALVEPPEAPRAFLDRVQAQLARAEADVKHALTWGWRPGSTERRHLFGPTADWAGLSYWLDASSSRTQGISKKLYAPEVNTPPVKAFFEGVHRSVHPVKVKALAHWGGTRPVEEVLLDGYRFLERESRSEGGGDGRDPGRPGSL
jgi:hypothetical protein